MNVINVHSEKVKIIKGEQANPCNSYKNTNYKLLRSNSTIWYNKMCKLKQVNPTYVSIKMGEEGNRKTEPKTRQ